MPYRLPSAFLINNFMSYSTFCTAPGLHVPKLHVTVLPSASLLRNLPIPGFLFPAPTITDKCRRIKVAENYKREPKFSALSHTPLFVSQTDHGFLMTPSRSMTPDPRSTHPHTLHAVHIDKPYFLSLRCNWHCTWES